MGNTISVVIPVYNRKQPLLEALDSVLQQTLPPDEIIVVDDHSAFSIHGYLSGCGYLENNNIKVLRNAVNLGPSGSRNAGLACAAGAFIAFLDSDDKWDAQKLEKQMLLMRTRPELDAVYCGGMWVARDGSIRPVAPQLYRDNLWERLVQGWWTPKISSTMLMKKAALQQLQGFDPNLWHGEDIDLWMRAALLDLKVDYCPECLTWFDFDSNDRLTKHHDKIKRARAFLNKWVSYLSRHADSKTAAGFQRNTITKFAIETFVDGYRDRKLLVSLEAYFRCLWNKKEFYKLLYSKMFKGVNDLFRL
ncbi:MAG: glycosyltransferase [Adhaeribacter sp.]